MNLGRYIHEKINKRKIVMTNLLQQSPTVKNFWMRSTNEDLKIAT
jgi:hypothetical protein